MGYIAKLVSCSRGVSEAYLSLQRPSFLILIKYSLMITSHSAARLQLRSTKHHSGIPDKMTSASPHILHVTGYYYQRAWWSRDQSSSNHSSDMTVVKSWCCHQMTPDRKYNWLRQKKVVSASSSDRKHFYKILFGFVLKTVWILCIECRCVSVVLWLLHVTRHETVSGIWTFLSQQWQLWSRHETDGLCGKTKGFYFRSRFPFRQIRGMSECLSACWAIQRDNCS